MSFYVTLPSNASMNIFPNNKLTRYTTKLSAPMKLEGEYEVALVEIQFPVNWRVKKDGNVKVISTSDNKEHKFNVKFLAYETISDVLDSINEHYQKLNIAINFALNSDRKVVVDVPDGYDLEMNGGLHNEFGFLAEGIQGGQILVGVKRVVEATKSLRNLYVYSDIVEHQYVGDVRAPLLRVVAVTDYEDKYVDKIYDSPHYVPVIRNNIDTIEIDIRQETGAPVYFTSDRVLVKLHFRRRAFY